MENVFNNSHRAKAVRNVLTISLCTIIMTSCMNAKVCATSGYGSEWMTGDSVVVKKLGTDLGKILFAPDSVRCYSIVYKENIDRQKDTEVVDGHVRDGLIATLNQSQTAVLQFLLLSNVKNYEVDSIKVQSPYMPHIEFAMHKDTTEVSVVVSSLDRSWQIARNGKKLTSYNYVDSKAIERFCNYFIGKSKNAKK